MAGLAVCAVLCALGLGRFGYTMLLPAMRESLALSDAQAGDLATANMIGYLVMSLLSGLLASRFGPRLVVSTALAVGALSLLLTGLVRSYPAALAARLLTGLASGGTNVPAVGLLAAWFSGERRGRASGIAVSGSSLGLLVSGLVVPLLPWRAAWVVFAAVSLVAALVFALFARDRPAADAALAAAPTPLGDRTAALAVVRDARIRLLAGIYVLFGFAYVVYATFYVRHLTATAGLSLRSAGNLWSLIGAASIASGFLWGAVSDRLGRGYAMAAVFALQCVSFTLFGSWSAPAGWYSSSVLFALTAWSIPAIVAAAAADAAGPRAAPAALGFLTFWFGLGQAAGPFLAGRIAQRSGSFASAFIVAGAAALLGAVLSLAGGVRDRTPR